jgi:hypothetical protein
VKVGRDAFDEATRAAIESIHPHLTFDWEQIVSTPLPPPEVTPWRERRQQERAQRRASAELEGGEPRLSDLETGEPESGTADVPAAPATDSHAHAAGGANRAPRRRGRRGRRSSRSDGPQAPPVATESVDGGEAPHTGEPDQFLESEGDD